MTSVRVNGKKVKDSAKEIRSTDYSTDGFTVDRMNWKDDGRDEWQPRASFSQQSGEDHQTQGAADGMQQQIRQVKGPWIQPIENVV